MTVMQLNTQIYNSLGELSTNEDYLKKAANYLKKLVEKMHVYESENNKSEVIESLDRALREVKLHQEGKLELKSAEDLINEL